MFYKWYVVYQISALITHYGLPKMYVIAVLTGTDVQIGQAKRFLSCWQNNIFNIYINIFRISSDEDMCYMSKIQGMWIFT